MSDVVFTFVDDQVVDAIVEHLKDLVPLAEGRVYAISTAETLDGWDGRSCPSLIVASGDTDIRLVDGTDETVEENATEIHVSIHDRETEGDNLHRRLGEMVVQVVQGVHSLPFEAVERIKRRSITGVLDVADEGGGTRSARTVTFSATYYTEPGVADVFLVPNHRG